MLVPAVRYKAELDMLFADILYSDEYFFYSGDPASRWLPDLNPEAGRFDWAVVDPSKDRVIGYMSYRIDSTCSTCYSFGIYCFDKGNPVFGADVGKLFKKLVKCYHRIEWRMIQGNPVQRHYDKLLEYYGKHGYYANRVFLHDRCREENGTWHGEFFYEICNGIYTEEDLEDE